MKVAIIGGGAAGLVCGITAKNENNEVIILERNKECGKKILVTGNGKCNYWNTSQRLFHYQSSKENEINKLINETTEKEVLDFFDNLGVLPKYKNGYMYPNSNQSSTIKELLVEECKNKNIEIITDYLVESIEKVNDKFIINKHLEFDKIVLATGSYAAPKTGSTGMGYDFLKHFNHTIIKPLPALVQLKTYKFPYLNEWKGIRTDVNLTHIDAGKIIRHESGEIQLTDYGISGICVFNLSNRIARGLENGRHQYVLIDFLPSLTNDQLIEKLENNKPLKNNLLGLLNKKLVQVILNKNNLTENISYNQLTKLNQVNLLGNLKNFQVEIIATNSYDDAQVCSGGVSLDEVNLHTMESKKENNLYIIGELLDLTGDCGGYNLGIAWRSGIVAGKAIRGNIND